MPHSIRITIKSLTFEAELNETKAAEAVCRALPLEASVNRWGDEIYFMTSVAVEGGDAMRDIMVAGELAYWPPGKAFCVFWGPTPASINYEPRAASDVVPIGRVTGDLSRLSEAKDGWPIRIERL